MTEKKAAQNRRTATKTVAVDTDTAGSANASPDVPRPVWDAGESRRQYHDRLVAWKLARRAARHEETAT